MKQFYKKFYILKNILQSGEFCKVLGTSKTYAENGYSFIEITFLNLKENSDIFYLFKDGFNNVFLAESASKSVNVFKTDVLDLKKDLTVIVCVNNTPVLCSNGSLTFEEIQGIIKYAKENNNKQTADSTQKEIPTAKTYNDEAIAEENYYELENENVYIQDVNAKEGFKKEETETQTQGKFTQNENDFSVSKKQKDLSQLAEKFNNVKNLGSKNSHLNEMLGGEFYTLNYNENKVYVVGKIIDNNYTFFAYGVKSFYGENSNGFFVPDNDFNHKTSGYNLVFENVELNKVYK